MGGRLTIFTLRDANITSLRGGRCTQFVHGRSRMTIDPRISTMPGRSTSGFHQRTGGGYSAVAGSTGVARRYECLREGGRGSQKAVFCHNNVCGDFKIGPRQRRGLTMAAERWSASGTQRESVACRGVSIPNPTPKTKTQAGTRSRTTTVLPPSLRLVLL